MIRRGTAVDAVLFVFMAASCINVVVSGERNSEGHGHGDVFAGWRNMG